MTKISRPDVYKIIDGERDYQDSRWGNTLSDDRPGNGERTTDEYALYILGYTNDLVEKASHFGDPTVKLDIVRKIAALCVACMEQNGAPSR